LKKNSSEGICGKVLNVRIKDNFTEELVLSTRRAQAGIAGLVEEILLKEGMLPNTLLMWWHSNPHHVSRRTRRRRSKQEQASMNNNNTRLKIIY
jgi:hypothetical protein